MKNSPPKRFTFKKGPKPTGLSAVGTPHAQTEIRLSDKSVGWIEPPTHRVIRSAVWKVWLHVKNDEDGNCPFKNIQLKRTFETEPDAREWLNSAFTDINAKFQLHQIND